MDPARERRADARRAGGPRRLRLQAESWPPAGAEPVDLTGLYPQLAASGYDYGPHFQGLRAAWRRGDEVFADVALPDVAEGDASAYGLHPALLDATLHAWALDGLDRGMLPFSWRASRSTPPAPRPCAPGSSSTAATRCPSRSPTPPASRSPPSAPSTCGRPPPSSWRVPRTGSGVTRCSASSGTRSGFPRSGLRSPWPCSAPCPAHRSTATRTWRRWPRPDSCRARWWCR
ncbi:polyketide synthase dehydratase domain-containing protein [Streptomyces albulus]|nr:polyketide synthase dehydratase domain-containing protein [Streptomyces noursei]